MAPMLATCKEITSYVSLFADDNRAYLRAVLRLTDVLFTAELNDPLSEDFKSLAGWLEKQMMSVYRDVADVRDVNVVSFR